MNRRAFVYGAACAGAAGLLAWLPRRRRRGGEVREVRFVRQLGLGYLQLYVMEALGLVERHARALGHPDLTASYRPVSTPTAMNDLLISGGADIVAAGFPPFLTLWDKTRKGLDVRGLAALACQPLWLNANAARLRSPKDLGPRDRIAVPAVKVSAQSTYLQMIAEKLYGLGNHEHFDPLTVGLSHPEAAAALMTGGSEITAHFASSPLQNEELRQNGVHRIANSYDATDGPSTTTALWAPSDLVASAPISVRAVVAALAEATELVREQPAWAAEMYQRVDDAALPRELVVECIRDPDVAWGPTPRKTLEVARFLARIGRLSAAPARVEELFFPGAHLDGGS